MRANGAGKGRDWATGAAVTAVAPASPRAETTVSAEPANRLAMRLCMSLPREDAQRPSKALLSQEDFRHPPWWRLLCFGKRIPELNVPEQRPGPAPGRRWRT